jgi:Transposase domain (DUF772)
VVKSYRGSGSAGYHPALLLGLLVYGYTTGVFSSRKLERATYDSVAFRFIATNDRPDHNTIATFRRRFSRTSAKSQKLKGCQFVGPWRAGPSYRRATRSRARCLARIVLGAVWAGPPLPALLVARPPYAVTATLLVLLVAGCFAMAVFAGYEVAKLVAGAM